LAASAANALEQQSRLLRSVISAIKSLLTANTYRRSLTAVSPLPANHVAEPLDISRLTEAIFSKGRKGVKFGNQRTNFKNFGGRNREIKQE